MFEIAQLFVGLSIVCFVPWVRSAFVPAQNGLSQKLTVGSAQRSEFFDLIRGIAILAVVFIHVTYFLSLEPAKMPIFQEYVNNALRFALPVFFVSSGVLLSVPSLQSKWLRKFYWRRFLAVGVPYGIIVAILCVYREIPPSEWLGEFLTGRISVPYYFVPILFQLYILYPFIYDLSQKRWFVWFTLGFSFVAYLVPELRWYGDLSLFTSYLFFFVWGIYLRNRLLGTEPISPIYPWLLLISAYFGSQVFFGIDRFYNGQFFYGIAIILLVHTIYCSFLQNTKSISFLTYIGQRTLWIFLLHFFVLQLLFENLSSTFTFTNVSWIVLLNTVGVLLCVGVGLFANLLYEQVVKRVV